MLFECWIFFRGLSDCGWLIDWYGSAHNRESIILFTERLARSISAGVDCRVQMELEAPGPTKIIHKKPCEVRSKTFSILGRITYSNPKIQEAIAAFWRLGIREGGCRIWVDPYYKLEKSFSHMGLA